LSSRSFERAFVSSLELAIEAFASAAVVLRARTGSVRFVVESLEERIAEMEEANAAGSLRLEGFLRVVWFGFVGSELEISSESESESWEEDALSD